jgi:acyl-CoA thioester hydrolase
VAHEFKVTRQVEFSETDMAGIMHFSNFFRFMETAEHGFFRSLGFSIHSASPHETVGWPRVHAECDYKHPLRFEDVVEISLTVREKKRKTLTYGFVFRRVTEPVRDVAYGALVVACVRYDKASGTMTSIPIPEAISKRIEAAPGERLD